MASGDKKTERLSLLRCVILRSGKKGKDLAGVSSLGDCLQGRPVRGKIASARKWFVNLRDSLGL